MLYSIVPEESVFDAGDEEQDKTGRQMIEMNGVELMVEPSGENAYQIVQLFSSNPQDFLNEKYAPGKKVKMKPLLDD